MAKAFDIIRMMIDSKMEFNAIIIMIKFFESNKELKLSEIQGFYTELKYTDDKSVYDILKLLAPMVKVEFSLDYYKMKNMLWWFCDYKKIITKEQKQELITLASSN